MTPLLFLQQTLLNPVLRWFFAGPLFLIILDVLSGIIAAARTGTFSWKRVDDFLGKDIVSYLTVSLIVLVVFLSGGIAQATAIATTLGMAALCVSVTGSIVSNIREIGDPTLALVATQTPVLSQISTLGQAPTGQATLDVSTSLPTTQVEISPMTPRFTLPKGTGPGLLSQAQLPPEPDLSISQSGKIPSVPTTRFPQGL